MKWLMPILVAICSIAFTTSTLSFTSCSLAEDMDKMVYGDKKSTASSSSGTGLTTISLSNGMLTMVSNLTLVSSNHSIPLNFGYFNSTDVRQMVDLFSSLMIANNPWHMTGLAWHSGGYWTNFYTDDFYMLSGASSDFIAISNTTVTYLTNCYVY